MALAVTLPPAWFSHVAVAGGLAPVWAYAPAGVLAILGLIPGTAFARKGLRGIAPSRDRRRQPGSGTSRRGPALLLHSEGIVAICWRKAGSVLASGLAPADPDR